MITLWADQFATGLIVLQLALAGGLAAAALLRVPGRRDGLAATLRVLAIMPSLGLLLISQLVGPLMSEAHSDRTWSLVGSLLSLDALLIGLSLTLVAAARRASAERHHA